MNLWFRWDWFRLLRWLRRREHHHEDFRVRLVLRTACWNNTKTLYHYWSVPMPLTIDLNTDAGGHVAVLTATNLDGSIAQNVAVTYASDNQAAVAVDGNSGALTVVGVGAATITGTGTRGKFTHSASDSVTVTQDANTGEFSVALALT